MSYIDKEKLIEADIASIENRVRHAFNQGYDLGYKEGKERARSQAQEPISDKYEYHIDHTDFIWYGNDSDCSVTCSQYRDGWNDAMEYIFKGGKGYQPYRREE